MNQKLTSRMMGAKKDKMFKISTENFKNNIPILKSVDVHYFDYASTTFMPSEVMDRWVEVNSSSGVFIGRGNSKLTKKAESELQDSEKNFYNFFNLSDDYSFIYTKNVTESINIVALGLDSYVSTSDIVLVGPYEHHSNYLPWKYLARRTGALFCEIPVDMFGNPDYSFIDRNRNRIKIVSVSHISNSFGYRMDIKKMCQMVSDKTLFFVDQSQVSVHMPIINDDKITAHFLASHKMYGPKNIAAIAMKNKCIEKLCPVLLGGGMVETIGFNDTWLEGRKKFFVGTMDIGLISAWSEACKFISSVSYSKIQKINDENFKKIIDILKKYNLNRIMDGDNCSKHIISFVNASFHAHDLSDFLSDRNVIIRSGNLCSQNALRKINAHAINRISIGIGTDSDDIEALDKSIGEVMM